MVRQTPILCLLRPLSKIAMINMGRAKVACVVSVLLTLAARGLEEPWNSQELLIESVGLVSLFCVLCHIVPICLHKSLLIDKKETHVNFKFLQVKELNWRNRRLRMYQPNPD